MPSSFLTELSPTTRGTLAEVLQKMGLSDQAAVLADPQPRARSRQAHHAQLRRARASAKVGAILLAAEDLEVRRTLFSAGFARIRPLSADMHRKLVTFGLVGAPADLRKRTRLFEAAWTELVDASRKLATLDQDGLLRIHNLFCAMHLGPTLHGAAFQQAWRDVYRDAVRRGLLEITNYHMQLSLMGSYAGDSHHHEAWLMEDRFRDYELADFYLFARRDEAPELFLRTAAVIRGERVSPTDCLQSSRPASTIRHLIEYLLFCMRGTSHLDNAGHTWMLLRTIEDVQRHLRSLASSSRTRSAVGDLGHLLRRFEHVQRIDKGRFWKMVESLPARATRERLTELWQRSLTT